jgi:hypothetical protein
VAVSIKVAWVVASENDVKYFNARARATNHRDMCISAATIALARRAYSAASDVIRREILENKRRISGEFFGIYSHRGPRRFNLA